MVNNSKFIVRSAAEPDLDSLCELYFEFHEFHARHLPDFLQSLVNPTEKDRMELRQAILKLMENSEVALLVAEQSGTVIGFAEIHCRHLVINDRAKKQTKYAHLQSLSVAGAFQRKGIGALLLQAAEAWAREQGAQELRLDIWEFSASPLVFYNKAGYRTFRRSLIKNL